LVTYGAADHSVAQSCYEIRFRNKYLHAARAAGITWPLPDDLSESQLRRRMFPPDAAPSPPHCAPVDFAEIHQEQKWKGVTKQLINELIRRQLGPALVTAATI